MDDFRKKVLRVNEPREHKVNNSLGVYDSYKWIRKNRWLDIGQPVTEHDFYKIIRTLNEYHADCLAEGKDVTLPHRLGRLELRKYDARITFDGTSVKTNLPIDWDNTLRLWSEDIESFRKGTLIRLEEKEIFKIFYNRGKADFTNKGFYHFTVNRDIKRRLKHNIKRGLIDAFSL